MGSPSHAAYKAFRARMRMVRPSPPSVDIYLSASRGQNHGIMQTIFNHLRSGEWLSTIACEELYGVPKSRLYWFVHQIRRRGWPIEAQTVNIGYTGRTFTQYRITRWDPV